MTDNKNKFLSGKCESYMHKYAKTVLAGWLRTKISKGWKSLNNIELPDDLPKNKPCFSVYLEYPVCMDPKTKELVGLSCEKNSSKSTGCNVWKTEFDKRNIKPIKKNYIPIYKDIEKLGLKFLQVFDVAVVSDEKIVAIFEIKHKHAMTKSKINFVKKHSIPTYEVCATWIMERVKIPYQLEILNNYS